VSPDRPTILFTHGNASDVGQMQEGLLYLSRELNVNMCAYDYSGYGLHSIREPSERNSFEDIEAVYDFLIRTEKIDPSHIILHGQSLGSGPTCHLAAQLYARFQSPHIDPQKILGGIVIQSGIESAIRVVSQTLSYTGFDIFQNHRLVPKILCPAFVIHGTVDSVVPFIHGKNLSTKFPNLWRFWQVEGSNHNDIEMHKDYIFQMVDFVQYIANSVEKKEKEGWPNLPVPKSSRSTLWSFSQ